MNIEDKLAIQELTSVYANAMDDSNLKDWMSTWDENGLWVGRLGEFKGTEMLNDLWKALGERIQNRRHVMTNFVISGDGDTAEQTCYMIIFDRVNEPKVLATGVYQDRLIKVGGQWKFTERRVNIDPSFRP